MDQLTINIRCQQWLQMIQEQKASGLTIEAWCRENNISKHCYYYRLKKLRQEAGARISRFVEVQAPQTSLLPDQKDLENLNSAASIACGKVVIGLSNHASEELISRIVRVINAQ
jgi:hypothetical protein